MAGGQRGGCDLEIRDGLFRIWNLENRSGGQILRDFHPLFDWAERKPPGRGRREIFGPQNGHGELHLGFESQVGRHIQLNERLPAGVGLRDGRQLEHSRMNLRFLERGRRSSG